jgi:hypothetical protein
MAESFLVMLPAQADSMADTSEDKNSRLAMQADLFIGSP